MNPKVSVILPNYNGKTFISDCIDSFLNDNSFLDYEIIFIDDGSKDGSLEFVKNKYGKLKNIKILGDGINRGYDSACNIGFNESSGIYILLFNIDTKVNYGFLNNLVKILESEKEIAGVVPIQYNKKEDIINNINELVIPSNSLNNIFVKSKEYKNKTTNLKTYEIFFSGVILIKKEYLLGKLFEDSYFMYGEDVFLCWRLRLQNFKILITSDAKYWHYECATKKLIPSFSKKAVFNGHKNTLINFLIFYEKINIIKLFPLYLIKDILLIIYDYRNITYRLNAYYWVIKNIKYIKKLRNEIQKNRKVSDKEILKQFSYKIVDETIFKNIILNLIFSIINGISFYYCRLVKIENYENNN